MSGLIRKIGLTGGIASGKSSVAVMLAASLDCRRIDVDKICRALFEPGAAGWRQFCRAGGEKYLTGEGRLNRPLLRQDIFADARLRQKINRIIHPLAKNAVTAQIDAIVSADAGARVIVEVPLLFEARWENIFDTVVVVYADYETCLNRLMKRDNIARGAAENELASQMDLAEKADRADYVIDNSGMVSDTAKQVARLAAELQNNGKGREKKLDSEK